MATKTGLPTTKEELVQMLIDRKQPRAVRESGTCTYLHSENGGCAIGMAVTEASAIKMEGLSGCTINTAIREGLAPKRLTKMGKGFLKDLQEIHDEVDNWFNSKTAKLGGNGLVWDEEGVSHINNLITKYKLNIKELEVTI
jgi:hypothetical protein